MKQLSQKGFSAVIMALVIVLIAGLSLGGWYVWKKNQRKDETAKPNSQTSQKQDDTKKPDDQKSIQKTNTADWVIVTTQGGKFSMKLPDGWKVTSYPGDYLGAVDIVHTPGTRATIDTAAQEYVGHSLRFRASIAPLDDAGLGPQWSSPQPGLEESDQIFSIGSLQGKRFKGIFSGDTNQVLYEYVFDLGNNKKLDIVYTIYPQQNEEDNVNTVEEAIKTIKFN